MKQIIFACLGVVSILSASCTKELKYTKDELLSFAQAQDVSAQFVIGKEAAETANCSNYSAGCLNAYLMKVQGLEFILLEFETDAQAKYNAKKIRGFHSRNWTFDDVTGEPILESFVSRVFDAKKP